MKAVIEFTIILTIAVLCAVGSKTYGQSLDYGNGCKMVKQHTDYETRTHKFVYTIDYGIIKTIGKHNFEHVLRNMVVSGLSNVLECRLELSEGWTYRYVYQSSDRSPDKPWNIMFQVTEEDVYE